MNEWWLLISLGALAAVAVPLLLYPLRKARGLVLVLTPLLFVALFLAYWFWGSCSSWSGFVHQEAKQQQLKALLQSVKSPADLIGKLEARLQQNPRSARGWYLLGRLQASQHQWVQARDAFARAYQLSPDDEAILVNYAHSLFEINHQQYNSNIRHLLKTVLQKKQTQPDALAMLAMDAFTRHDYLTAIDYWQTLLTLVPSESEEARMIRKAIAKAQAGLS